MISSIYIASIPFIVMLFTFYGLLNIIKKPINLLFIIIFTFLFKNFYVFIGTRIDIWMILSLMFLAIYFFKWLIEYRNYNKNVYEFLLIFFIIYVVSMTLINQYFFIDFNLHIMKGGFLKNEGRIISQLVFFFLTINLIFISYFLIKDNNHISKILYLIILACKILTVFAIFQYVMVNILGQANPFPISGSDGILHSGYILDKTFRLNSIAGEPKHLGIVMALGIILLFLSKLNNVKLSSYTNLWILSFVFVLFYTYSTTGYALTIIGIGLSLLFVGFLNKRVFLFLLITTVISITFISYNFTLDETFISQSSKNSLEIQDLTVYEYLINENIFHAFIGTGLGNIHHFAADYFPSYFPLFKDNPYKANSGILFMLADYGLIGIIILYSIVFFLLKRLLYYAKHTTILTNEEKIIIYFTVVLSILFLFRYYELFFIFLGIVLKINKLIKEREIEIRN